MHEQRPAARRLAVVAGFLLAAGGGPVAAAEVRLGERPLFVLHEPEGETSAEERARLAEASLAQALADPACGPEMLRVLESEAGPVLELCSRHLLTITELDARHEGTSPDVVARTWAETLRGEFARRKHALYSARLLRRAIAGLLLPLGYLLALFLVRLLSRRIASWAEAAGRSPERGTAGGMARLSGPIAWRAVAQIVLVAKWTAYVLLTYVLAVAFLQQFPGSASWATVLLRPVEEGGRRLGPQGLALLPRLFAAVLLLIAARAVLGLLHRVFDQIRAGRLRLEPLLSAETAGPAEVTARVLTVALTGAALVLLLVAPGQTDVAALGLFAFLGLAFVLGARQVAANLIGGLVILYSRPFRVGQRVRAGEFAGSVTEKRLFHTRIETSDAREVLLPNVWILARPVEVLGRERLLRLRATLAGPEPEVAAGLLRHAAAEAGCRREEGRVLLVRVHEERLTFDVEWPLPRGADVATLRSEFLRALIGRAPNMQVRVLDVEPS